MRYLGEYPCVAPFAEAVVLVMASRCRSCGLLVPNPSLSVEMPLPQHLAHLEPHLATLIDAAKEFDKIGLDSAVEFVRWVSVDVQHAAGAHYGRRRPPVEVLP